MMIKPGISELQKCVDSRYTLVTMASKRARMLGGKGTDEPENQAAKPVSEAVQEIADGKVGYVRRSHSDGIAADRSFDITQEDGADCSADAAVDAAAEAVQGETAEENTDNATAGEAETEADAEAETEADAEDDTDTEAE